MKKSEQILVVDDELVMVDIIGYTLEISGYQVTKTSSSIEALNIITRKNFDLIFLDLAMPELNGAELFYHIRQIYSELPVVIITGYPDSDLMRKAIAYDPFVVMKKPFVINDILNVIRSFTQEVITRERDFD